MEIQTAWLTVLFQLLKARAMRSTRFNTYHLNIDGCMACGRCYKNDGKACVFDYDFNKIAPILLAADAIVFASSLYWFTFPYKMKAVIDKFTTFASSGKDFAGKLSALIACAGLDEEDVFKGLDYTYTTSMKLLNCRSVGKVLIGGVYGPGEIEKTDGPAQAAALADKLFNEE